MTSRVLGSTRPEPRLDAGWQALPLPALIVDGQQRILAMNHAAELWLNMSATSTTGKALEAEDMLSRLRIDPPLGPALHRVLLGEEPMHLHRICFDIGDRAGGHHRHVAAVHLGPMDGKVSVVLVPQEEGAEYQGRPFRTAARTAIGMSEMLAHEIKNPLAGIRGAAQLIGMSASPEDREMAEMIVSESRRIAALLDQVEQFGDTSAPNLQPVNVHDVLEKVRRLAAVGFASHVRFIADYDPSLPLALADADQLMQVCLNLVKNAAEALIDTDNPTIRLRSHYDHTSRRQPDLQNPVGRSLPLTIEVEDNGSGISPNIADNVFEPFVSGRENGTGLGLALVSKIIADHSALLRVDSRVGRTVFHISLPKA